MWSSQRLASIGLESWQGADQARRRDRRGIRPIVTLLEERTLLSQLPGTWAVVAPLPTPRTEIAGATGLNGLIYAIGGDSLAGGATNEVDAYNAATNTWTTVASLPTARYCLAAATGTNGLIYAIGGTNGGATNEVDAYNPATNTWTTVANLPTPRKYHAAATGSDGRIYTIGGDDGNYFTSEVDAYNPATNAWTTVASLPTARATSAVAGSDGRIYAIGGSQGSYPFSEVDAYDPAINTWTAAASLPDGRYSLAAATGPDGRIYAIGGDVYENGDSSGSLTNEVDAYLPPATPLSQTISFPPIPTQTYGVAPLTLTAMATSNLPVSYTVISGPATVSGDVLKITGAGNVEVEADQPGNTTYAAATPVDESFTVAPAQLTVNATNESMTDGGTVPALTFTYTGLVNGDTSATFSGSLATTATNASSVGSYPITQGSLAATGNYTIGTYDPGTLTVNAAPLTVTVTTLADDPSGSIPGYTTLRDAITEANTGPTRSVEITFAVTGTIDLTSALPALDNNISIEGPGASNLTVQRDSSAPDFSVFTVDSAETVAVSGMTIAGGNATNGGGIANNGKLTVIGNVFTGNNASYGGGIYNIGTLTVIDSTFTKNGSLYAGGGIENSYNDTLIGTLAVTNSTFINNSSYDGAGINNLTPTTQTTAVTNCDFITNSAADAGGGFGNWYGTSTVTNSTFTGNSAESYNSGGIFNDSSLTITNSTITSNGGGISEYNGVGRTLTLRVCSKSPMLWSVSVVACTETDPGTSPRSADGASTESC